MDNKAFLHGYLVAAIWTSVDDNDDPLDEIYDVDDFTQNSLDIAEAECNKFIEDNKELLEIVLEKYDTSSDGGEPEEYAGHDFWLTRNHHGVGFWDRGFGDDG